MAEATIVCPRCGGGGTYDYVDEDDYTVWVSCPACEGVGTLTGEIVEEPVAEER